MSTILIPIAISSQLDETGEERIHIARITASGSRIAYVPVPIVAGPILLIGSSEYRGTPSALEEWSGQAPAFKTGIGNKGLVTSATGLVLVGPTTTGNTIFIYRWDSVNGIYVNQPFTGSKPIGTPSPLYRAAVSDDGVWVLIIDNISGGNDLWVYKYNGAGYSFIEKKILDNDAGTLCFSPDNTQVAISTTGFSTLLTLYNFNTTTGALTEITNTEVDAFTDWLDWKGSFILCSDNGQPVTIRNSSTLSLVATSPTTNIGVKYQAYFSSDGAFIYYRQQGSSNMYVDSFNGTSIASVGAVDTGCGTQPVTSVITKDRNYLLSVNSGGSVVYSLSGATLTEVPSDLPFGNQAAVWTGLPGVSS